MKSVIFARVSSREQEETGYSLPSQEKLLKEYGERKDFAISKKFSISESASGRYQRKTFNEMLEYVKENNINIIICEKVDRLTRNLRDAVSINEWINDDSKRQVHFVKENCVLSKDSKSNEKFIWNIKVSVAQYYIDNLSEEVRKGQKEKLAQGWLPTKPPLGYKTIGDKGHKTHVIDWDVAPYIRKMFEYYSSGNHSLKSLVAIMYQEGMRNREARKICRSRIHVLLSNPFYYGKILWKGEIHRGEHEPIISKELFNKVQACLVYAPRMRPGTKEFNFVKIFKCGKCGSGVTASEKFKRLKSGSVNKYIYYHCMKFRDRYCHEKYIREDNLIGLLLQLFDNIPVNKIQISEKLNREVDRHRKFVNGILGQEVAEAQVNQVNIRNYAKYILQEGTRDEKREIMACLDATIFIKDAQIYIKEK